MIRGFVLYSIVSSPFFYDFAPGGGDKDGFELDGTITTAGGNSYNVAPMSDVHNDNAFTRVTVDGGTLLVEVFKRKGALLAWIPTEPFGPNIRVSAVA